MAVPKDSNDAPEAAAAAGEVEDYFAWVLRHLRERLEMSQEDLAKAMTERGHRWHQTTVHKAETKVRQVRLSEAASIAAILGVPVGHLTGPGEEDRNIAELLLLVRRVEEAEATLMEAAHAAEGHRRVLASWIDAHWARAARGEASERSRPSVLDRAHALASRSSMDIVTQVMDSVDRD